MFDSYILGLNIRRARNEKKMTQKELAEKLSVTVQAISKWEQGISCPDIFNLYALSEVMMVSTDSLLGNTEIQKRGRMMIAIDGGGTKTEFILFSEYGEICSRIVLEGSNPNSCGLTQTYRVLKNGIDTLLLEGFNVCGIFAGIAGVGSLDNKDKVTGFLKRCYPRIKVKCQSDILNVLGCALNPDHCTVAICGTGSVVYVKKQEDLHRVGGWGCLLDKGGSGYDIGRDALCVALAQRDGIGEKSLITELVEEKLGGRITDLLHVIYQESNQYVASFAPVVFEADRAGDAIAHEILINNANRLSFLIKRAVEMYGVGNRVFLAGSLVSKEPTYLEMIQKEITAIELIVSQYPQIFGACIQCCALCGVDREQIINKFALEYGKVLARKE